MTNSPAPARGLTLTALKSQLWDCAKILRGSAVDRTDWKAYILPLLFFKRICDVWDEETAEAAHLYGDVDPVDFPEVHRFVVPEDCHWRDVRETPANVGTALAHAMREIERANPDTLYRASEPPTGRRLYSRTRGARREALGRPLGRVGQSIPASAAPTHSWLRARDSCAALGQYLLR